MSVREYLVEALQNQKIGTAVATTTSTSGLGTFLNLIPNDIGKLATLVGIVLSIVLIYANILGIKERKLQIKEAERRLGRMSKSPDGGQDPRR